MTKHLPVIFFTVYEKSVINEICGTKTLDYLINLQDTTYNETLVKN